MSGHLHKGILLYVMKGCSHEDRAEEIYNMRTHIRRQFSDVRARSDIIKVLWNFAASTSMKYDTGFHFNEVAAPPPKKTRKRKAKESDGEESDYRAGTASGTKSRAKRKSTAK